MEVSVYDDFGICKSDLCLLLPLGNLQLESNDLPEVPMYQVNHCHSLKSLMFTTGTKDSFHMTYN